MSKRFIVYKDESSPYPRAGLWYAAYDGKLWECWAHTGQSADKGPTDLFDHDFRCHVIGRTRRAPKDPIE